uniref:Uncharacterized protein n=1 Tax=Rhizophora mucronata TaxID=61149 RepID=A0A2P2J1F3_RHIMU
MFITYAIPSPVE